MKNFTNNFKQFTSRLSARWLIMALMMLVGTSSAWAGMWINDNNGWNIEIERNGTSTWIGGTYGFNREDKNGAYKDYSAENTTSLKIKNAWVKASSNDNWQIRYAAIYCRVSTNQSGNFSQIKCKDYGSNKSNANSIEFQINDIAYDVVNLLAPGTYYLDYYFSVGNDGCDKGYCYAPEYNCNGTNPYCSNCQNCNYYSIKFKVPEQEKKYSLGGYIQVGNAMADQSTYYSTYDLAKQTDGTYKGTFSFSKSHNNAQYIYIVDNAGTKYGPQTNDYPMSPGNTTTLSKDKSNKIKATIALNTKYVFTFNPTTGAFTYSLECTPPAAPNVTGTTNVVKCGDNNVTTNGTITIDNYVNTSTYKLQLGSNEAQTVTPTNGVFSVSANGIYTLTVTNSCGSSKSTSNISVGLTQNQVTISDIFGSAEICSESSAEYYISEISDVAYDWSINSDKFTLGDNGTNSIQVTATGTADATATLTVTATKSGCSTPQTKSINLIALPTITTVSPTEGTVCSSTTISALEGTLSIDKSANSTTKWYKDGEEKSPTTTVETGKYTIKAVSNTGSCVSSTGVTYNVTGITTIPTGLTVDINGQPTASICGGSATINAKATGATSYTLYKGDNNIAVETKDGVSEGVSFTVSEQDTYKVKATNNCGSTDFSSKVTLTVVNVPSKPEFVTSGETTCAGVAINPNLSNELASGEYLVWYDADTGGNKIGTDGKTLTSSAKDGANTYYAAVSNGTCESAERTPYTVDVEADPIVDLTLTLVDGKGNSLPLNYTYCQGDDVNVKLTYNGGIYWGEPEWNSTLTAGDMNTSGLRYDAVNKKGEGTYTISNLQASGTLQVALTMCGDTKATSNVLNVNITPQAETPTVEVLLNIEKCGNDIRQFGKIQINPYNAGYTYEINETEITPNNNGIVENLSTAGSFTLYAINSCGVPTASAPFTIIETDNKPTISNITISNSSPVINEDVLLTVQGEDIASVEWSITSGTASLSDAFGNSVKLSSTVSGAVTVTAKAISAYGCETTLTKEVTFIEEEDCTPIISKDIQITFYHPSTYNEYNSQKGQWWGMGTMYYSTDKKSWLTKDMGEATSGSKTVTIQNITSEKLYVYFESKWTYHVSNKASTKEDIEELTRGNRYDIRITSHGNDNVKATSEATCTGSLSTPVPLSTPAVKTVSAISEEGSGVVKFTGQIIKTGCAATSKIYYGYQFKKADEEWPTTGVEASNTPVKGKLIPLTNASETALYYQFSADVENLEDGDYHFRAYIINGYDFTNGNYDQGVYYGLDKLVTVSTVKAPVTKATIQLIDADGKEVDKNKKYCVGETGYIKVTSDVKYTTIKWKTDKGTEIEETGNDGVYPFVAKGDDNIWVMLSNKHNKPESPAINENPLVVNTFADPILPRVSLNKVSICSNDAVGATVKLTNVVKGQTYQLYQQIDKGDGTFTEQAIGEAKTQTEEVTDKTELVLHSLNNTYTTGKYFVKTYTSDCEENKVATQPFTFTVVDAAEVFISIDPASAETTPWMPAKFTVNASDKYTLNVTKGIPAEPATEVEVNQNGNKVSVKIPLPQGSTLPEGTTGVYGQYENVVFPQNATTQYTITATLSAAGGDNPCAAPTSATITLVPYEEECTKGH